MKEVISDVKFLKEGQNNFGPYFQFAIFYDGKKALYRAKSLDQKHFVAGQEAEFTEEERTYTDDTGNPASYLIVKPVYGGRMPQSGFGKALKKEQTKYSGFAVSYAKDLVIAGKIDLKKLPDVSTKLFKLMVDLDKSIES